MRLSEMGQPQSRMIDAGMKLEDERRLTDATRFYFPNKPFWYQMLNYLDFEYRFFLSSPFK